MIIGLASPPVARSVEEGLHNMDALLAEAASRDAEIVCFPEAYLPGLRGQDFEVPEFNEADFERAIRVVSGQAKARRVAVIAGMERPTPGGRQITACVFDSGGALAGWQTKNQIDPTEDRYYIPGDTRRLFEINGVKFGIAICHEGWRYPETVRWAAVRGASIVFHPQHTGSNGPGPRPDAWGSPNLPYYEKAMTMRSIENGIYFASVNYALPGPESATSVIDPDGTCIAYLPYGTEGVLIQEIDPVRASRLLASRYAPERYREGTNER